jgi:hypothetical protein
VCTSEVFSGDAQVLYEDEDVSLLPHEVWWSPRRVHPTAPPDLMGGVATGGEVIQEHLRADRALLPISNSIQHLNPVNSDCLS